MGIRAAVQSAEHERIESQDERQAIIPASEPTGRRAEAEPGGDPARVWQRRTRSGKRLPTKHLRQSRPTRHPRWLGV